MFEESEKHAVAWFHWLECAALLSLAIYLAINATLPVTQLVLGVVAVISAYAFYILTIRYSVPLLRKIRASSTTNRRSYIVSGLAGCLVGTIVALTVIELVRQGQW